MENKDYIQIEVKIEVVNEVLNKNEKNQVISLLFKRNNLNLNLLFHVKQIVFDLI